MSSKDSGQRIREIRERRGLSLEAVAELMGLPNGSGWQRIRRWETGETRVQLEDLEKLAKALDVPQFLLVPDSGMEWVLQWFEATARQVGGLPEVDGAIVEAMAALVQVLGPLPDASDEGGWELYLQRVRVMLLQTQRDMIQKIVPR